MDSWRVTNRRIFIRCSPWTIGTIFPYIGRDAVGGLDVYDWITVRRGDINGESLGEIWSTGWNCNVGTDVSVVIMACDESICGRTFGIYGDIGIYCDARRVM